MKFSHSAPTLKSECIHEHSSFPCQVPGCTCNINMRTHQAGEVEAYLPVGCSLVYVCPHKRERMGSRAVGGAAECFSSLLVPRVLPGCWRPKSSQSDLTMSSSDGSPVRRPRPHSIAGRLPNYASPTVSFQVRTSRSTEKKSAGNLTVCYRFRKLSSCFLLYHLTPSLPLLLSTSDYTLIHSLLSFSCFPQLLQY